MPLLELRNVRVSYGRVEALSGISLMVEEGEIVALLGANGAGKSTTLRTISGMMAPTSGEVVFAGQRISGLGPEKIVRLGLSHVAEGRRIFPGLTVRDNIMLGASNRRATRRELNADVEEMFALFPDIRPFADTLCWKLSGGQLQMAAVARGLTARPKLLLLDEPSLGLAPLIIQKVFEVIREIQRRGTTVLLVEQNANMALSVADRGYVLETGLLKLSGKASDLAASDEIRAAYLGGRAA
ncbi:MAG: ABC transporter ATP-binding protein [Mesorhizobium sp.]|nr:ABC transporter ATP-binding protein [Mesorhizobium sp.]MBN9245244.1 ABC transporter ATP-binding protein [Mesorhizobium sp.]